ncbi:MAG TPA: radical SAM protein [Desulfitobacteriaceae bacterium]|nr:radical SAM protein [Desulfitobacteriaceae bacterium]
MKILLLEHPRKIARERCNDIANTPLSSSLITGYTAGMLASRNHEVKIVEGYLDKLSYEQITNIVGTFEPDILGIHLIYSWQNNEELFSWLRGIKGERIKLLTAYGFYPTFAYAEILEQCPEINAVIVGEPEQTFVQLAEKVPNRITGDSSIPGLAWKDEYGHIRLQRHEPEENLDLLPYPVRTEALLRMPQINIEGSRGCYGGCTFCYINPFYGKPSCWRGRSPENIMAEIDNLLERYGKRSFYFVDPNFFGPGRSGRERVLRLAALLKERGITFGIEGRVNDITEETISPLVEAGLQELLIGLESGRNESLKRLNKMTTVEQNEKAIKILRKYGIEPNIGFIMFEPDSSLEDIRTNLEFLQRNNLLNNLPITANVLYHPQIILQGTKAYQDLQREGRLELLATTYEGTAAFANREVAALAQLMSKITNYLFLKMEGIWSGSVEEPAGAEAVYHQANQALIRCFSETLTALEADEKLRDEDIEGLADKAIAELKQILCCV